MDLMPTPNRLKTNWEHQYDGKVHSLSAAKRTHYTVCSSVCDTMMLHEEYMQAVCISAHDEACLHWNYGHAVKHLPPVNLAWHGFVVLL